MKAVGLFSGGWKSSVDITFSPAQGSCRSGPHIACVEPGRGPEEELYKVGLFRRLHSCCWSAYSGLDKWMAGNSLMVLL